ncbi:hypothetical protein K1T71_009907 [Dendrolimus kikuchii]|uniref:Uncharacterized protein n=1 Tax=Dendrolimus kikuchii TaxID=765133 RepID=A0ACC1CT16_9NEOP|nr:hypothetical protein K1T71_009907 [Dendrolimus kikuchii]
MSDFPDPDEEYELMYADELELLREAEHSDTAIGLPRRPAQAKRSLDFTSPEPKSSVESSTQQTNIPCSQNSLSTIPEVNKNVPNQETNDVVFTSNVPFTTNECYEVTSIQTNKRTADDLFGDINDIDFNEIELPSKKQKTEEEEDLDLINRIIEGRKLRQLLAEPTNRLQSEIKTSYDFKENVSLNIPRWAFVPLTNSDGERIYIRLESEDTWEKALEATSEQSSLHSNYIGTWEEARKILETKQQELIQEVESQDVQIVDTNNNDTALWVDKYRPQSYLDLLSEEPVNRALLHWLHLWDKIVFKKEVKVKEPQQKTQFSKRAGQFQLTNKWRGKKEVEPEVDEDGRPHHKVALLCGPPGVGKTTLAHLLARLAGYRPVELNASDERSTEAFRNALQCATLMRSVLDAEKRPNCLILDEIDGAPLPTVELLVKWCTATVETGKKKAKSQPLKRPVIAICNDLYATSLRPLRPVSLIVQVGGVSLPRLASRLSIVSQCEGLCLPPHVASALAARAHGDVRAAIQVLSFIKARARAQLNMEDVENVAIGTKDCNKTLMQALQSIFTINDKDPEYAMKTVQAAGEYDRLADGIFENYLTARVDARLLIACETMSWLRLYDMINSWTLKNQNYSLYGALPLCITRCHRVLSSRTPQRIKFPSQAMEMYRKKLELESIVVSVWRGSAPSVALSRNALQLDLLPLIPYLLSPSLRSANVQLCSENERKSVRTCAGAMCDYGLQYIQQRTPEGLYAFVLEPDVYKIAFYGTEERVRPPPAVRQAIAREQQLEVIRRNEEMAMKSSGQTASKVAKAIDLKSAKKSEVKETHIPNHLQRLKPKEIEKKVPQVHKDFFGRVVPIQQVKKSDAVADVISSSNVFYQYREGFNNAVRRNVRTRDLL